MNLRVLVIDDEPLARERLSHLVEELPEVELAGVAASGEEALLLAGRLKPEVVLLDIRMPGMDGLEAAHHLARMPEPPAPNAWVNAFTPPLKQQQDQQRMQGMVNQQMGGPQFMSPYGMQPMMNPYMQPMMNPYMSAQAMPYGQVPYGQPMMASMPQRPFNYMVNYQGPMAPNPFQGQGIVPVGYQQPAGMMPYQPLDRFPTYVAPMNAMQPTLSSEAIYVQQLIRVLTESHFPAQREWAATTLAALDWRAHPQIVQAMIHAARHDPAATVRAGCVYCLVRMNANVEPVTTTFQTLRQDADPRVRQEAETALVRFGM